MNWDAHRYSALIASNCWTSIKSAKELNWNHHSTEYLANTPFCKGVWKGAVYPDDKDVWHRCSEELKTDFYMTPECPPPPPYHHKPRAVYFVDYYITLARKAYLSGDEYRAGFYFGIASHYADDVIIEPYILIKAKENGKEILKTVWEYEEIVEPVNSLVLEWKPDYVVPIEPDLSIYPSIYDLIHGELMIARSEVAREKYRKAVARTLSVLKTMYNSVVSGYYKPYHKAQALMHAVGLFGGLVATLAGVFEENFRLTLIGTNLFSSGGMPYIVYAKYRKLW